MIEEGGTSRRPVAGARASFDVIIAGGGTAGAVVAARLAESGRRVLVLEAGPDYGPFDEGRWPAELVDASTIPTSHDWGYDSGERYPGRVLAFERARVFGGSSAHNGCTVSWGHRSDYDGWAARGLDGWSAAELLPLFAEVSRRMRVRRFRDEEITPFHRAFIEAGVGLGLPNEDRLESLDARPAVCAEPSNSPNGVRWNAAFAYLDPVRHLPELEIRGGVLVDRVLFERHRAVGVRAIDEDGPFEAFADLVVMSAGTYGSPSILMRSGVGPAADLRSLGIEVEADLPGVGANLHDQPSFEIHLSPSAEYERRATAFTVTGHPTPDEQGFAIAASSRAGDAPFDLHVFSEIDLERRPSIFAAVLAPRSRGRLSLVSTDPAEAPSLDHGYLSDPDQHDLVALVDGVELARSFAARVEMAALFDGEVGEAATARTRAELARAVRRGVIHYWHPVGTCAMGVPDDPAAVVDPDGRVHGLDGLVVVDASVMPSIVRATTNLPVLVIAERIARALASATS